MVNASAGAAITAARSAWRSGRRPPGQIGAHRPQQTRRSRDGRRRPDRRARHEILRHRQRVGDAQPLDDAIGDRAQRIGWRQPRHARPPSRRCRVRSGDGHRSGRTARRRASSISSGRIRRSRRRAAARCSGVPCSSRSLSAIRAPNNLVPGLQPDQALGRAQTAGAAAAQGIQHGAAGGLDRVAHGAAVHPGMRLPRRRVGRAIAGTGRTGRRPGRRARDRSRRPPAAWRGTDTAARSPGSAASPTARRRRRRPRQSAASGSGSGRSSDSTMAMLSRAPSCCGA